MGAFPATDFSLCMYQIPEKCRGNLKEVIQLAKSLEMAKFRTFWKDAAEMEVLKKAVGWETAVRGFIAGVVAATYRSIKEETLGELLTLPASDLDALIKEQK